MSQQTVLVTTSSFGTENCPPLDRLRDSGLKIRLNPFGRRLSAAEIIGLGDPTIVGVIAGVEEWSAATFDAFPSLRALSRCGTGMDSVDLDAAAARNIGISNTPDAPTQAVAELTLALMLGLLRQVPALDSAVKNGEWPRLSGALLSGKVVGLVGYGRIGRAVARLVQAFGASVIVTDPRPVAGDDTVRAVTLLELAASADIVSLHADAGAGKPVIDVEFLSRMRKSAYLVNTARGALVDEAALLEALQQKSIRGAALDVFCDEPYRGPLAELDSVVLTPHVASSAAETRGRMECEAAENLANALTAVQIVAP
ncbi:phosphoglycerate dehydrogenase [Nisaea sediminum]|uniref:phosphoglycerate dehydrogenase n=1 Tax=Nisaea sediminum TaxID=2775867 RepID=UPI001867670C|nr:phosphoglycerate dehydrogenase [Nisaea sediminum]